VHEDLIGAEPRSVDLVARGVLAQRRHEPPRHPLALHAQRVDHVGVAELVERDAHAAAERLDLARDQGGRPGHGHLAAHAGEGEHVRARHPAVQDVADDPHLQAVEGAGAPAQRVEVEQRLGWVLALAVAGVDHRGGRPARDELGRTRPRRADDDERGVVGGERADRVLERLALVDRRALRPYADGVRGQALGGELERRARARRGLVEQVENGAPAQGGDLLDRPA
jgi:hypothetical protein